MTVIGITGPSGAGKGEIARIISNIYDFRIIDADKVYHSLVSAPSECLDEIRSHFGDGVIRDNSLDRRALSRLVFGEENRDKLILLNSITHKHVVNEIISITDDRRYNYIIDAPLLIEAGLKEKCDFTISVIASSDKRACRIAERDGISVDEAELRICSQKPDRYYIENTDHYIINDGDLDFAAAEIRKILKNRGFET